MHKTQPDIFFSYAWGGEKEEIALRLYQHLQQEGYKVNIDRYDVAYKGNIVQFMKRMGRASFIVVVISDKYLKSPYCMFELLEIFRKSNSDLDEMLAKIYPIVMDDAQIFTPEGIAGYIKYWKAKAASLKKEINEVELEYAAELVGDFKTRHEIALNIGLLTKMLGDIKSLGPEELSENNFATITAALAARAVIMPPNGLPHHLTAPPFLSEVFLGREDELAEIHKQLFEGDNLLLLVNGMGGVGKTSLATRYYHTYSNEYAHLAWVLSEKSIANALLLLALPLGVCFDETMPTEERMQLLLAQMANLNKPCLLIIDNANELEDLQANYASLRSCPNFHLLLTTRITAFAKAATCQVGALPYEKALQLFTGYYTGHDAADDALFEQVYNAVEGNTLIIELLAKNLDVLQATHTGYCLAELVADLKQGVLKITQTKPVESAYHDNKMFPNNPLDIIAAMYDIGELAPAEKRLLSILAVLPAESISFTTLQALLPATQHLGDTLHSLSRKGWIAHDQQAAAFKISPVIQEITRAKNGDLLGDCGELINTLTFFLKYQGGTGHFTNSSYQEAPTLARYGEIVLGHFILNNAVFNILLERLGRCHQTLGNLPQALHFYTLNAQLCETLIKTNPDDANLKNGLAISFSKLGQTYADMGNLPEALRFYTERSRLGQQLYDAYPDNVAFKNGLAISFSKLGQTYSDMGNLPEALRFYELDADLTKQLYDAYPHNVAFKNGLAISYSKLGQTYAAMGNLQEALRFYTERSRLGQQLYDAYPDNVAFKNGLAVSYAKLGRFYKNDDAPKARQYFEQAQKLWIELVETAPQYAEFNKYLTMVQQDLADLEDK
jgi:tetratricopeptide (TPR) repeat protein